MAHASCHIGLDELHKSGCFALVFIKSIKTAISTHHLTNQKPHHNEINGDFFYQSIDLNTCLFISITFISVLGLRFPKN